MLKYSRQIFSCILLVFCIAVAYNRTVVAYEGVLNDSLVLGVWLYKSRCVRCHSEYAQERLAEDYSDSEELVEAIASDGCTVSWSKRTGGEFGARELASLAEYMLQWEEKDGDLQIPELPPLLAEKESAIKKHKKQDAMVQKDNVQENLLDPALQHVVDLNSVVMGGWLYTRNCYRCHLDYQKARMGKGMKGENLLLTIAEGKTSTQMKPFSRLLGGSLKNKEITSIKEYITTWEEAGEPLAIAAELMTPPAADPVDFAPVRLPRFKKVFGDKTVGASLYRKNCLNCHGSQGEGYIGRPLNRITWVTRPDLFFKSVIKSGIPGSPMNPWDQNKGGRFSAQEIDNVVCFVLSLNPSNVD